MKKVLSIILTVVMLCSIFALPAMAEISENERLEILKSPENVYLDITEIDNAYVKQAYGYIEQNAYDKGLKKNMQFDRKDTDPTFSRLMNTNFWTKMGGLDSFNPAIALSNLAVKYYDITSGVESGALTLYETKKVEGTVGVADETTGLFSQQPAEYNVYTYLLDGINGKYKIGPVAEPNKDADGNWGDDVYSTTGAMVITGATDKDGDGISNIKTYGYDPYTGLANTTANETLSSATLSNINKSADYVNILHLTLSFNESAASAKFVPVTITYADGGETTEKYLLDILYNVADPMSVVLAVENNEDGSKHTATQLDTAYTNKNFLTSAVSLESLGLTGVSLNNATFENKDIIGTAKTKQIGLARNRNSKITTADNDGYGVYSTTVTEINRASSNFIPSDFSIPVDRTRTISSVKVASEYTANDAFKEKSGMIKAGSGTYYYYLPVYFDAYEGDDYSFYIRITRNTARKSAILGMTLSSEPLQNKIDAINVKLDALNPETATEKQCVELRNEINALVNGSEYVYETDFHTTNLVLAEERLEEELEAVRQEAARQEAMTKRTYNYLTLSADRDVFVTWKDVTDLARFNYNAEGTTSKVPDGFNTATYAYSDTETIPDWIPYVRTDGTKVTGKEYYYYKGFKNFPLTELSENEAERGAAPASATYAYLLDDITAEDGTTVTGKKVAGISSSGDTAKYGSDEYYAGSNGVARATTDTTKTVTNPEFVQKLDEDGYAIIKKNKESKTYFKIGPVVQEGYSPNAQLIGSSINNVNVKGTTLDLLITATDINYSTTYYKTASAAINFAPAAALQQVTVTYEDGETDTKYAVVTDNKTASWNGMYTENPVLKTIVFAPKYEEDGITEIEYDENSFYANKADYDFKILKGNTATVGLTDSVSADDVSFKNPHIIMSSNTRVAQVIQIRQDAMHNKYGAFSSSVSLPLANKKVESIAFPVTQNIAIDDPSAIVVLDNAKDASKSTVALLPVTIKGASDDYVYFAYLGRISSETYLMAATVTENSSKEKIEAAEAAMSKITVNSTIEEAKKAAELYNRALEDDYVKESDFNSDIVTAFNNAYKTIRESVEISGKIAVKYFKGEKPSAEVEIYNPAELAGKTYKVILAYYDEKGNYISSKIHDGKSTTAEKVSFTIVDEECPENAAKVKGFIWKGFDTLLPLATADETTKKDTFKVLSIGNSYSNNAHSHLVKIAADAGFEKVEIANIYKGGCTLKEHYNNAVANTPAYTYEYQELAEDGTVKKTTVGSSEADGEKVTMLYGIQANDWDVITIQQQSLNSGVESSYVKEQIDYLVEYINKNKTNKNAKLVWHMTWPYATYYTGNTLYGTYFDYNQNSMYKGIVEAVQTHIATRDDFDYIIPAGTAIQNARLLGLDEKELSSDGTHLNSLGCYVAGLTWFAKITGMSIDDITYAPTTVPEGSLDSIKTAVKNAIAKPYEVTK